MPQHKSCKKRLKTSAAARLRNRGVKSVVRNAVKSVRQAASYEDAVKSRSAAMSALDKAARRSVIHKRQAARRKARLAAHVAKLKG